MPIILALRKAKAGGSEVKGYTWSNRKFRLDYIYKILSQNQLTNNKNSKAGRRYLCHAQAAPRVQAFPEDMGWLPVDR